MSSENNLSLSDQIPLQEREQFLKKPSVIVCGCGIVGKHILNTFPWADQYDKPKNIMPKNKTYQFAFICTPTPMNPDGSCNINSVIDVLNNINASVYIIKSTVPPTTTDTLSRTTSKHIVFSPEYQGNTQHANINYNFVILGGNKEDSDKVAQLYQYALTANTKFTFSDAKTAELAKYMENAFLAAKVTFCNTFFRIANAFNVSYSQLRELFILDPRVNPSHTFVYQQYPFYDSKCFNKDLPAIVVASSNQGFSPDFIKSIININKQFIDEKR